jgi:hypothetical protein
MATILLTRRDGRFLCKKMKKGVKLTEEHKRKISEAHKGKPKKPQQGFQRGHKLFVGCEKGWFKKGQIIPPNIRKKMSEAKRGEKNRNWKGSLAGKVAIHIWLETNCGKPKYCEHCEQTDKKKYEWASKDHIYTRNINDYLRLCTSCHRKYDMASNNYKLGFLKPNKAKGYN